MPNSTEYFIECESCGEAYEGLEQIKRWMDETEIVNAHTDEWIWHCRNDRCRPENAVS